MTNQKIMVAGGGVLGSQIAMQVAYHGYKVALYDINEEAITHAKERVASLREPYKRDIQATDEL